MERLRDLTQSQYQQLESTEFIRMLCVKAEAAARNADPWALYQQHWGRSLLADQVAKAFEWELKAAITPATTTDSTWAGPLVPQPLSLGFLTEVRRASVLGQLSVLRLPFGTVMTTLTAGASSAWVGEGGSKPVSKMGFTNAPALLPKKASSIVVITKELALLKASGSEAAIQQILVNEVTAFTDGTFLGAAAATAAAPAGLLNGVSVSADLATVVKNFFTARPNAMRPTWIVSPAGLGVLALTDPNVPRSYRGFPIVTSPSAGVNGLLVDAAAVAVADAGVQLDTSQQAVIEMNDAAATPPVAATIFESLWGRNLVGIKCERYVNWTKDANAVQFAVVVT